MLTTLPRSFPYFSEWMDSSRLQNRIVMSPSDRVALVRRVMQHLFLLCLSGHSMFSSGSEQGIYLSICFRLFSFEFFHFLFFCYFSCFFVRILHNMLAGVFYIVLSRLYSPSRILSLLVCIGMPCPFHRWNPVIIRRCCSCSAVASRCIVLCGGRKITRICYSIHRRHPYISRHFRISYSVCWYTFFFCPQQYYWIIFVFVPRFDRRAARNASRITSRE